MSRPILCDWCQKPIEYTPGSSNEHSVKFDNDNPLDCCGVCLKNLKPKIKPGRPRGSRNAQNRIQIAEETQLDQLQALEK
jgi:hypothetical protein